MKNYLILLLSLLIVPFISCRNKGERDLLHFGSFPLEVPEQNSLMAQWEKKPVLETKLLDNMESSKGWLVTGKFPERRIRSSI